MDAQQVVTVRRMISQGQSVNAVADWLTVLLLANVPERTLLEGCWIGRSTVEGASFSVRAHRRAYECFYGNAVADKDVIGQFDIVEVRRDGTLGDVVFSFYVNDSAVFFADGTSIIQHVVDQQHYGPVRLQVAYQIMAAIQAQLPRYVTP